MFPCKTRDNPSKQSVPHNFFHHYTVANPQTISKYINNFTTSKNRTSLIPSGANFLDPGHLRDHLLRSLRGLLWIGRALWSLWDVSREPSVSRRGSMGSWGHGDVGLGKTACCPVDVSGERHSRLGMFENCWGFQSSLWSCRSSHQTGGWNPHLGRTTDKKPLNWCIS